MLKKLVSVLHWIQDSHMHKCFMPLKQKKLIWTKLIVPTLQNPIQDPW